MSELPLGFRIGQRVTQGIHTYEVRGASRDGNEILLMQMTGADLCEYHWVDTLEMMNYWEVEND